MTPYVSHKSSQLDSPSFADLCSLYYAHSPSFLAMLTTCPPGTRLAHMPLPRVTSACNASLCAHTSFSTQDGEVTLLPTVRSTPRLHPALAAPPTLLLRQPGGWQPPCCFLPHPPLPDMPPTPHSPAFIHISLCIESTCPDTTTIFGTLNGGVTIYRHSMFAPCHPDV